MAEIQIEDGRMKLVAYVRSAYCLCIVYGQIQRGCFVLLLLVDYGEVSASGIYSDRKSVV